MKDKRKKINKKIKKKRKKEKKKKLKKDIKKQRKINTPKDGSKLKNYLGSVYFILMIGFITLTLLIMIRIIEF